MQNAIAAVRFFASERQLRALAAKLRAPLNQFFNAFRSIFHQCPCCLGIAETITSVQRVLKMQADLVFIAQRGRNPTLRQLRGRILDLTFSQHYYASSARQFNRGTQTGNSCADDNEISFGWSALHMAKMLPLCLHGGFACDYVMMKCPMETVTIAVAPRPYEAVIEDGLLDRAGARLRDLGVARAPSPANRQSQQVFVITVPQVRRRWGKKLLSSLAAAQFNAQVIEMRDGEPHKKLATVEALAEKMLRLGADRDAMIVAFGGGVVGDTAGLLASLYMRGVDLVQIPTTVLAQVDASIGGKTGVNLRGGKNLLGTFHQPRAVLIDPSVLGTLPEREFRAGLYESLKCGVIGDPQLFEFLEKADVKQLRRNREKIEWVIAQSVKLKAKVVSSDERESGLRRVLNFGHTIGHALEAETNYRHFLHGEAVAWGMTAAAHIAEAVGRVNQTDATRIRNAVLNLGPLPKVEVRSRSVLRLILSDKKTRGGVVHFILPTTIGKVEVANDVPGEVICEAVEELRRLSSGMAA